MGRRPVVSGEGGYPPLQTVWRVQTLSKPPIASDFDRKFEPLGRCGAAAAPPPPPPPPLLSTADRSPQPPDLLATKLRPWHLPNGPPCYCFVLSAHSTVLSCLTYVAKLLVRTTQHLYCFGMALPSLGR
jgi:hypothetical protein